MRLVYILLLFFIQYANILSAQIGINTDGTPPDPSAIIDVKSTNKGALLPRMTFNERNAIANPVDGLIVFCTNCGIDGFGVLCIYTGSDWYTLTVCKVSSPIAGNHLANPFSITWNWNAVPGATGYKWSKYNLLDSAVDVGTNLFHTEFSLSCNTSYTRYIWAYSICGISLTTVIAQSTSICMVCGDNFNYNHVAGNVAPVNKSTTYGTVTNIPGEPTKCWITSNLGSDHQATNYNDDTEASAGWYWQFNKVQGYKHDGTIRTPNSSWISSYSENANWASNNDPCALELGNGWRIPTRNEWTNVDASGGWANWLDTFSSPLKLHVAGRLNASDGSLLYRGAYGIYWSSTQTTGVLAWRLNFNSGSCALSSFEKPNAFTIRCIKD